jgi:hypothetical protein
MGAKLQTINLPEGLTRIDDKAFDSSKLTIINLPATLQSFNGSALLRCQQLQSIHVHPDNKYFTALDGVLYSKDMTTLVAFPINQPHVTYFKVPDSVYNIGQYAFSQSQLVHITLPDHLLRIEKDAFMYSEQLVHINLPDALNDIPTFAFCGCAQLNHITLPTSLLTIGEAAFTACRQLENIVLPNNVKHIHNSAFSACEKLQHIKLPNGLLSLGHEVFTQSNIKTLHLPPSLVHFKPLEDIRAGFYGNNVQHFSVDENNKHFTAVDGVLYNKNVTTLIHYPQFKTNETFIVPHTVTAINEYAFSHSTFKTIFLPNNIQHIGCDIFLNNFNLTHVYTYGILNNPENNLDHTLHAYAFHGSNFQLIMIPDGIHVINSFAFDNCTALQCVKLPSNLKQMKKTAFYRCGKTKIIKNVNDWMEGNVCRNCTG